MSQINVKFLQILRHFSLAEGISTLVLFGIAMPLKYFADMPGAVTVVGSIHGVLFVGLMVLYLLGMTRIPLSIPLVFAGILGAIVPFGPFVVDRWLKRLAQRYVL